jgi:hypothetical protein
MVEHISTLTKLNEDTVVEDFKTATKRFMDQGKADEEEIKTYIADFKLMKPKIKDAKEKDIDQWKDWGQFKSFVDQLKTTKSKGQEKKEKKAGGATLVVEDKYWKVYHITTHEAAMLYGSGTRWCITQKDGDYWDRYSNSDFYFYISKRLPPSSPYYKIALQVDDDESLIYWDSLDNQHGESEGQFYGRRNKHGGIPFNLPDIPEAHLSSLSKKLEKTLYSVYLKPGTVLNVSQIKTIERLYGDSVSNVPFEGRPTVKGDFINMEGKSEQDLANFLEIIGQENIEEISGPADDLADESLSVEVDGKIYGYVL